VLICRNKNIIKKKLRLFFKENHEYVSMGVHILHLLQDKPLYSTIIYYTYTILICIYIHIYSSFITRQAAVFYMIYYTYV